MAQSGRRPIRELLTNNTIRNYYALDEAMMEAHFADKNEFAESTARQLLQNDDLPLLLRARACIVLGCSDDEDFLDMAKEAVRIARLGHSRCSNPGELENNLVHAAEKCLEEARAAWDAKQGGDNKKDAGHADEEADTTSADPATTTSDARDSASSGRKA